MAEEALFVQHKELTPDNIMLTETLDLLKKLDSPSAPEPPEPIPTIGPPQPIETPHDSPLLVAPAPQQRPVREETIDIDGHQSPGEILRAILAPPQVITRPVSPFEQRNKFSWPPNPWSMLM
ncbi:hypothetical protein M408DRAFT_22645 [Serendipita vermifera MAFF 305830]|uniref:Uncharacterized protein n=1 Tax=Serendipita vermifera MAFF 305830 TaxID=933852 RepID=A0A0C3BCD6_SERVB|nr:hypothetical protein M408DRAFT_22645 [Serendipita vermifera MAFF 305830]